MPAITKPNQHFDALTWTGTGGGSGATRSITGLNFQPDFIWEKARSSGTGHQLLDSVRGVGQNKVLASNSSGDEPEAPNTESLYGWLSAINSDGFTLTNGTSTFDNWNKSGDTYVGWTWKAGGTAVTNTSGTISSQVSANPTAGFSVVTFTAPASGNFSAGHGLGVTPGMVITKVRGRATSWITWHNQLNSGSPGTTYYVELNTTGAQSSFASVWGSTGVTSSVIGMGVGASCAANDTIVAYCFAPVAGYSSFGSYVGNGSSDGPFVYCGFKPRFVMVKSSVGTNSETNWVIWDSTRTSYNGLGAQIFANQVYIEGQRDDNAGALVEPIDFLSNGFKIRSSFFSNNASSSYTYIYAAFAEAPFKFSNGR
jgi:hypothetical protein